jgi:hypothetical protein
MKNKICVGDIVSVNFNSSKVTLCGKAQVQRIPQAVGDSWVFKDSDTEEIYYVSEGCTITLLEKKPTYF